MADAHRDGLRKSRYNAPAVAGSREFNKGVLWRVAGDELAIAAVLIGRDKPPEFFHLERLSTDVPTECAGEFVGAPLRNKRPEVRPILPKLEDFLTTDRFGKWRGGSDDSTLGKGDVEMLDVFPGGEGTVGGMEDDEDDDVSEVLETVMVRVRVKVLT